MSISGNRLHAAMENQFLTAMQANNTEVLKRCLRIYATVDKVDEAEKLIRAKIIAPFLEDVITSASLHSDPLGLQGICVKILSIIPEKLDSLLKLTHNKKQNFEFVTKSLWPEVVEKLEQNLPQIFSAGNPDQFHKNYTVMMTFLVDLEKYVENPMEFHNESSYQVHTY